MKRELLSDGPGAIRGEELECDIVMRADMHRQLVRMKGVSS